MYNAVPEFSSQRVPHRTPSLTPWLAVSGLCLLLFLIILVAVRAGWSRPDDRSFELAVHATLGRATFPEFEAVSFLGSPELRTVLAVLAVAALLLLSRLPAAVLVAVATAGAGLLDEIAKFLDRRPRPHLFPGALHASGYSFPSGHSMGSIVFFGILAYLVWHFTRHRAISRLAVLIAGVLTALVGLSRIVLGVHYPTDVLAGFALGGAWLALLIAAFHAQPWSRPKAAPAGRVERRTR